MFQRRPEKETVAVFVVNGHGSSVKWNDGSDVLCTFMIVEEVWAHLRTGWNDSDIFAIQILQNIRQVRSRKRGGKRDHIVFYVS